DAAEPVLQLDPAILLAGEVPQHLRRVDGLGRAVLELDDTWVARVGEVERQLVVHDRREVFLRLCALLARPRRGHLLAQLSRLEALEVLLDMRHIARRRYSAGDDRLGGLAG